MSRKDIPINFILKKKCLCRKDIMSDSFF